MRWMYVINCNIICNTTKKHYPSPYKDDTVEKDWKETNVRLEHIGLILTISLTVEREERLLISTCGK